MGFCCKDRETFWQRKLKTYYSIGLNEKIGVLLLTQTHFLSYSSYETIPIYLFVYHHHHFIYFCIYLCLFLFYVFNF